jgi:hypothetical protein
MRDGTGTPGVEEDPCCVLLNSDTSLDVRLCGKLKNIVNMIRKVLKNLTKIAILNFQHPRTQKTMERG